MMFRAIQLLQEKNHFLEKFLTLNEKQIHKMESGEFDAVENFYNQREDILKIIKYIDAEINKAQLVHKEVNGVYTDEQKRIIKGALTVKDQYVEQILEQDICILALIDQAKTQIIKELQDVRLGQRAMAGYKSKSA